MSAYLAEFVGTLLLLLLGNGVVANVSLKRSKGENAGWLAINAGYGLAVFVAVFCVAESSGAHINPAVTIGLVAAGNFPLFEAPGYILAQLLGAAAGGALVWLAYRDHFAVTESGDAKLGVFCTGPAIRNPFWNLLTEAIATFVLVYGVLHITSPDEGLGSLDALPVALLVVGIGLSLGGPTGYAINPARDLGPRVMHFLLPVPKKRDSDWGYAWVPVVGPSLGGLLAGWCHHLIG